MEKVVFSVVIYFFMFKLLNKAWDFIERRFKK